MSWSFRPVRSLALATLAGPLAFLGATATTAAAPLDLPAAGARKPAVAAAALQRFGKAFKARKLAEAEAAARDAWAAGGGAEALEALAVSALHAGRVPRAHQLYTAIMADAAAPEDVRRRAANQLAALERQTGDLVIRGGVEGAPVTIDGDAVATLPLVVAPRAMPGQRVVGVGEHRETVRFTAGRTTQVVAPAGASGAAAVLAPAAAAATAAAVVVPVLAAPAASLEHATAAARDAAREAVADTREAVTGAALARPEVQAALAARDRALAARAALARLKPERLRELLQRDPELKRALAELTDDQAVLQQVALAMQSGGGLEGIGRQLAGDARVQRVLTRLKTLLLTDTGVQEVFE